MYTLQFSKRSERQLSKMDPQARRIVLLWLKKNINNSKDPRAFGKALKGNMKGMWRYRIGDYRVICEIKDDKLVVLALLLGHRREVYGR